MEAREVLTKARRSAGLTQRAVANRAGIPQSTVARIESGSVSPRTETLEKLLGVCGYTLELGPLLGDGIDRTQIRRALQWTPRQRVQASIDAGEVFKKIRRLGRAQL